MLFSIVVAEQVVVAKQAARTVRQHVAWSPPDDAIQTFVLVALYASDKRSQITAPSGLPARDHVKLDIIVIRCDALPNISMPFHLHQVLLP